MPDTTTLSAVGISGLQAGEDVKPGYRGARPSDGTVYVHRAHMGTWALPFEAEAIGEVPMPWGVDPDEAAERSLRRRHAVVRRLQ